MSNDLTTHQAKRVIIGRHRSWIKKFDSSEYLQNEPMIEKLFEEKQLALLRTIELESELETLTNQVHELELDNQKMSMKLDENKRQSLIVFSLSLLATILIGIGVNVATGNPYIWVGWIMIVAAVIIEFLVFWIAVQYRN
jgi:hypothetical protein